MLLHHCIPNLPNQQLNPLNQWTWGLCTDESLVGMRNHQGASNKLGPKNLGIWNRCASDESSPSVLQSSQSMNNAGLGLGSIKQLILPRDAVDKSCRIQEPHSATPHESSLKAIAPWNALVLQTGKPFHGTIKITIAPWSL